MPIRTPPAGAPPRGEWNISAITQDVEGRVRRLHGKAEISSAAMLLRADDIEYDEDSGDVHASGNVYFHNFERNEQLWASRVEYNTDSETGKFYDVRGEMSPRIDSRPGVLTSNSPFHFEGKWAERLGERYVLHDGFVTNCRMPNPWWKLRGPKFDIEPGDRAIAYRSIFLVRHLPLFYTPFFYKSLARAPRKSGFLMPNVGNSTLGGPMFGAGYFWAPSRSYDVTYRFTDYTSRGFAHNADFRGKPRPGTDFNAIFYGVQDRGRQEGSGPLVSYSGASLYIAGKSDLGDGWNARGAINYITSFRFRQQWSQSFNELIGSEIQSVGFLNKNRSYYTLNLVAERLQNFQSAEIQVTDPVTNARRFETNAVTIRKLPEVEFSGRDHQIWKDLPVWFSFGSSAGLLYRQEPDFQNNVLLDNFQTSQFMDRVNVAPRVTTAFHWGGLHLVPSFGIQETYYSEAQTFSQSWFHLVGTNLVRSSRDFSVDLIFPSLARIFSKKTIFGDKLKHVIEPRATYRNVVGVGGDFIRFVRFDQTDLVSNTNELDISLTNRIYAKRGNTVTEIFTWELSQARYFDPTFGGALIPGQRNVILPAAEMTPFAFLDGPRNYSPVVSSMHVTPFGGLGVQWRADYDPLLSRFIDSTVSVDYRWKRYFTSVGQNQIHTVLGVPANQFQFRGGFGDATHRGLNAGFNGIYDLRQNVLQYATAQVTYNTDCCGLSVQYGLFNVPGTNRKESMFRVAFAIANIGSFGTLRRQDRTF